MNSEADLTEECLDYYANYGLHVERLADAAFERYHIPRNHTLKACDIFFYCREPEPFTTPSIGVAQKVWAIATEIWSKSDEAVSEEPPYPDPRLPDMLEALAGMQHTISSGLDTRLTWLEDWAYESLEENVKLKRTARWVMIVLAGYLASALGYYLLMGSPPC